MKTETAIARTTCPNTVAGRFRTACAVRILPLLLLLSASTVKADQYGDFTYWTDGTNATITGYTGAGGAVNIPSTIDGLPVTSIGDEVFWGCTILTSVTIPNSVTSIGYETFAGCTSLTSVTIGNSVTSIGDDTFSYCTSLTAIMVDASNSSYSSVDGVLFNKNQTTLIQCPGGKAGSYTIPGSVTSIGYDAFDSCTRLISITIPDSVTSIEGSAFFYCTGMISVTIPNSVTSIQDGAFCDCYSLTSVTIGNSVTSIGWGAFEGCSSLTSITIPNSVTDIGYDAFYGCSSLTSITIGNSVTSIGNEAFYYCTSLTSVTIGNSVTSIGNDSFYYCTSLTSVTIGNSVASIGNEAFFYCTGLTSVTIPNSVTSIGNRAFLGCSSLTSVTIGSSVTSIGYETFSDCTNLTGVYFLGNAPSHGSYVFEGDNHATVYYLAGTRGWVKTFAGWGVERKPFGGRPTALWQGIRCTVTAGSKGDSISFSSIMNATADDFDNADFIEITISDENSDDMDPCVITFLINGKTWKNGKFSYSGTENGVKKSFKYDVKTHGFTFAASNIDLSGLECPLTIDINVGNYTSTTELDETIVNGRKPIPIELLMGVKDSLRVDKSKFTKKSGVITHVAIKGGFSVEDVNDANMVTNPLDVNVGSQTFTIPPGNFKNTKSKFTCSKVKLYDSSNLIGIASATFDFNKCTFTLTIKNTNFAAATGTAEFNMEFGDFNEGEEVSLP